MGKTIQNKVSQFLSSFSGDNSKNQQYSLTLANFLSLSITLSNILFFLKLSSFNLLIESRNSELFRLSMTTLILHLQSSQAQYQAFLAFQSDRAWIWISCSFCYLSFFVLYSSYASSQKIFLRALQSSLWRFNSVFRIQLSSSSTRRKSVSLVCSEPFMILPIDLSIPEIQFPFRKLLSSIFYTLQPSSPTPSTLSLTRSLIEVCSLSLSRLLIPTLPNFPFPTYPNSTWISLYFCFARYSLLLIQSIGLIDRRTNLGLWFRGCVLCMDCCRLLEYFKSITILSIGNFYPPNWGDGTELIFGAAENGARMGESSRGIGVIKGTGMANCKQNQYQYNMVIKVHQKGHTDLPLYSSVSVSIHYFHGVNHISSGKPAPLPLPKSELPNKQHPPVPRIRQRIFLNIGLSKADKIINQLGLSVQLGSRVPGYPWGCFGYAIFYVAVQSMGVQGMVGEWGIWVERVGAAGMDVVFRHRPAQWTMIKVGFWACARPDIYVGTISSSLLTPLKQSTTTVSPPQPPNLPTPSSSILRAFITGFTPTPASSPQIFIRAFDKSISPLKIEIGVQVGGLMEVSFVRVGFVVFVPAVSGFASYGGGVNQVGLVEGKLVNVQRNVHSGYVFHGIANLRQPLVSPMMVLTQIDSNFYLRIDTLAQLTEIYISYLVIGVSPSQVCSACKDQLIAGQDCVAACPSGTYLVGYKDGGRGCRACPGEFNMVVNQGSNGCVCRAGFVDKKGYCVEAMGRTEGFSVDNVSFEMQAMAKSQSTSSSSIGQTKSITSSQQMANKVVPYGYQTVAVPIKRMTSTTSDSSSGSTGGASQVDTTQSYSPSSSTSTSVSTASSSSSGGIRKVGDLTVSSPVSSPTVYQPPLISRPAESFNYGSNLGNQSRSVSPIIMQPPAQPQQQPQVDVGQSYAPNVLDRYSSPAIPVQSYPAPSPPAYQPPQQSYPAPSYPSQPPQSQPQPQSPQSSLIQILSTPNLPPYKPPQKDCSALPNTYWTGYKCSCKVGFNLANGLCLSAGKTVYNVSRPAQFVYRLSEAMRVGGRGKEEERGCGDNQVFDGLGCVCVQGCQRGVEGRCVRREQDNRGNQPSNPPPPPPPQPIPQCPQNSSLNPQNQCTCNPGYTNEGNRCILRTLCGPYSTPDRSGQCQCRSGYRMYGGQCQECPNRQVMVDGRCEITCGVNEVVKKGKCQCRDGYGIYFGVCRLCPQDFFISNGYCVSCPTGSLYETKQNKCLCPATHNLVNGLCIRKCGENEEYNMERNSCGCLAGMTRINGKCQPCYGTINQTTQQCIFNPNCKQNQIRSGTQCICKPGFGYTSGKICTRCESIPRSFLLDSYCITCPTTQQPQSTSCTCPKGKKLVNNQCIAICSSDQLMDASGYCYYCPIGEEIVNGACACLRGYQRVDGVCRVRCGAGMFQGNGVCGFCSLNLEYDRGRKVCICPRGQYMNTYGLCEPYIPPPLNCGQSQFYSPTLQKCQPCPSGCRSCLSSSICTRCSLEGFYLSSGSCTPRCGDGIKTDNEACDDGNTNPGDGCFNCMAEVGWKCAMNVCTRINPQPATPPAAPVPPSTTPVGTNLKLSGETIINQNNVFASLQIPFSFTFASTSEMRAFMKYEFPSAGTEPTSAYCVQRVSNPKIYECLIIYASGVPNRIFNINFSYGYQGQSGSLSVPVNPFNSIVRTRSLK